MGTPGARVAGRGARAPAPHARADPYAVAGWLAAIIIALAFWGLVTLIAITLL